jgi:hypothetical protein
MQRDIKISYIYVNLHIDYNLNKKIIKLKMTTVLHSLSDYIVVTIKNV